MQHFSEHALVSSVAPPGFCNRGEVRYGSIGGLEYEAPPEADTFTAVHMEFVRFGTV